MLQMRIYNGSYLLLRNRTNQYRTTTAKKLACSSNSFCITAYFMINEQRKGKENRLERKECVA